MGEQVRDDIRFLGRVLGNVIAEQEGQEIFELVEATRRKAFEVTHGQAEAEELLALFRNVPEHKVNLVARAFSHFALIANIAEDVDDEVMLAQREDEGASAPDASLEGVLNKLSIEGSGDAADVGKLLQNARVSPRPDCTSHRDPPTHRF